MSVTTIDSSMLFLIAAADHQHFACKPIVYVSTYCVGLNICESRMKQYTYVNRFNSILYICTKAYDL